MNSENWNEYIHYISHIDPKCQMPKVFCSLFWVNEEDTLLRRRAARYDVEICRNVLH